MSTKKPKGSAKFWNKIANRYAKSPVADQASYEKKLELTRALLKPEMEVLEFGCGTGTTSLKHAPYVRHITAIDIAENMIAIAKKKTAQENIENVDFKCCDIEGLKAEPKSLDMVLAMSILHLLPNKEKTIDQVKALLKPGGYFVSSTACLGDGMKFIKWIEPIGRLLGFMPTVKVFTAKDLVQSIESAEFKIIEQWQPGKNKALFIIAKKAE